MRRLCQIVLAIPVLFTFHVAAVAQHVMPQGGYSFDIPRTKAPLPDLPAAANFPLSHIDARSQQLVNHALDASHGFWIDQSERLLREAIAEVPEHPMLYALAAYVHKLFSSGDFERANLYFAQASAAKVSYGKPLTSREDMWFEAVRQLYPAFEVSLKESWLNHIKALENISVAHPDDLEAKAFLALAYWNFKLETMESAAERAILINRADDLIESVIRHEPRHPVHHYKIHLWNNGRDDFRALSSARAIGPAQPKAAHLWHMPAHIFTNTGDYYVAWRHVEIAHRVDNEQLYQRRLMPTNQHNYYHNYIDYAVRLKARSGQVMDASERLKVMLAHGRLPNGRSPAAHQRAVLQLFSWLERFALWHVVDEFDERGLISGLETAEKTLREFDYRARVLRWRALAALHKSDQTIFERLFSELSSVYGHALRTLNHDEARAIQAIYEDTFLHREVALRSHDKAFSATLVRKLWKHGLTPPTRVGIIAAEQGFNFLAGEIFAEAIDALSEKTDLATLFDVLYFLRSTPSVEGNVQRLKVKRLIVQTMIPDKDIHASLAGLEYAQAFPVDVERLANLAASEVSGRLARLAPEFQYLLDYDHEGLAFVDPKHPTLQHFSGGRPEGHAFFASPGNKQFRMFVFSLGPTCEMCNAQLAGLKEFAEAFQRLGTDIHYVHPHEEAVSGLPTLSDPDYSIFKWFGAWDEFTDEPLHAVVLIDEHRRMLWHSFSEHAIVDVEFLLQETKRLRRIFADRRSR